MSKKTREKNFWRKYGISNPKSAPEHWPHFGARLAEITDEDLDYFTQRVRSAEIITLGENEVTNEGISYLPRLAGIRELDLKNLLIDDRCIPDLLKLKDLEFLNIGFTGISPAGIEKILAGPEKLKTLITYLDRRDEALGTALQQKYPEKELRINYRRGS